MGLIKLISMIALEIYYAAHILDFLFPSLAAPTIDI